MWQIVWFCELRESGEFVFRYVALYMAPGQLFFSYDKVESGLEMRSYLLGKG